MKPFASTSEEEANPQVSHPWQRLRRQRQWLKRSSEVSQLESTTGIRRTEEGKALTSAGVHEEEEEARTKVVAVEIVQAIMRALVCLIIQGQTGKEIIPQLKKTAGTRTLGFPIEAAMELVDLVVVQAAIS